MEIFRMNKTSIIFLFLTLGFFASFSQTPPPHKINYQGIARNAAGNVITSGPIGLKFEIYNSDNSEYFTETQSVPVSSSGVFVAAIGSANTAGFNALTWGNKPPYTLKVSADPSGGTAYSIIGQQELLSVPYALYAENVKNAPTTSITAKGILTSTFSAPSNYSLEVLPPKLSISGKSITVIQGGFSSTDTLSFASFPNLIWHHPGNANRVALLNPGDSVGIGTTNPTAKLEVKDFPNPTFSVSNFNTGNYTPIGFSSSSNNHSLRVLNDGSGSAVYGVQTSTINLNAYAGFFDGGLVTKGKTNFAPTFNFRSQNLAGTDLMIIRNDGFVGVNTNLPANRLEVIETLTANAAIFGNHNSSIASITAHGVSGQTSNMSPAASGIYGISTGGGPGVYGSNTSTTAAIYGYKSAVGGAGKFEIQNGSSPSDALLGSTTGSGAAIKATCPTGAPSNSLALLIENGHIKSQSSAGPTITCVACSYTPLGSVSISGAKTDVKGKIYLIFQVQALRQELT